MNARERVRSSKSYVQKGVLIFSVSLLLIAEAYCGFQVHQLSDRQKQMQQDYALVNSTSFGLLSVDVWRDQVIAAASAQIDQYRLTASQKADLKKEVDNLLHGLVDHAFAVIDQPQKTLGGKLKKFAVKALVDKKKVQDEVPGFSEKIMAELTKPSSYKRLANIADTAMAQLGKGTYDSSVAVTKGIMDSVFRTYSVTTKEQFQLASGQRIAETNHKTYLFAMGMLGSVVVLLGIWAVDRRRPELHVILYILSILAGILLLIIGLTTTMIEIDARIKTMNFHLLGSTIAFENQELFFQSKSILDVVLLLIKTKKVDSVLVGIMILAFSILFPFMKLISTGIVLISEENWGKRKWIRYFAFESGKWSMADVMVVAILMTYIGFNGIVESTMSSLNIHSDSITSITTNNTSIQPGYIIFIGFVIFGFLLSAILKKITRHFAEV